MLNNSNFFVQILPWLKKLVLFQWEVTQLGCNAYSLVSVPLYDTLGTEAISYIVSTTEMKTVVCDKEEKVKTLLAVHQQVPLLKNIITMDKISSEVTTQAENEGLNIYNFENFIQLGKQRHFAPQVCIFFHVYKFLCSKIIAYRKFPLHRTLKTAKISRPFKNYCSFLWLICLVPAF